MKKLSRGTRRRVRPRVPIAYAALLIVALVAVVGFAAFSPSSGSTQASPTSTDAAVSASAEPMSARVASAVLALRVSDSGTRTGTTRTDSVEGDSYDGSAFDDGQVSEDATTSEQEQTPGTASVQSAAVDTTPPSFRITSPGDGDTVESRIVKFTGTVEKGATVSSGPYEATVNDDGTWSILLAVVAGENGASFTATDTAGNTASERIVVNYAPPEEAAAAPAPPTTADHDHDNTTTTTASSPTTTGTSSSSKWSPNWPADAGGIRDVELWRPLVTQYWAADRVDCVLGIIQRESKGDPTAYNSTYGASGLMQHLIKYWEGRAASAGFKDSNGLVASPFNGEANIAAGAAIAGSGSNWYTPWSSLPSYGSCSG